MLTLEQEFEASLIDGYYRAGREVGYWGHRFLQAVRRNGGLATAKRILAGAPDKRSQGFDALLKAGRPDLSVEQIVLAPRFRRLFTTQERKTANQRLAQNRQTAIQVRDRLYPDDLEEGAFYAEGASQRVLVNAYERNPKARAACIKHHGMACSICGMTLKQVYGEIAAKLIHVHHLRPLASAGRRTVNPMKDMVPVCPNCHAVLHLRNPPLTPAEARSLLKSPS